MRKVTPDTRITRDKRTKKQIEQEYNALKKVVRKFRSQVALAKVIGVTTAAVCYWMKNKRVSALHSIQVAEVSGIPLSELRVDHEWVLHRFQITE